MDSRALKVFRDPIPPEPEPKHPHFPTLLILAPSPAPAAPQCTYIHRIILCIEDWSGGTESSPDPDLGLKKPKARIQLQLIH